jgi:hypothetical protein
MYQYIAGGFAMMFPFGFRPWPGPAPGGHRPPAPPPRPDTSGGELLKHTSFSPELSFLLAMTMKDGLSRSAVLDLLRDIEPFVSAPDREAIRSLLGARELAQDFRSGAPRGGPAHSAAPLSGYSRLSRQQALLEVLQRYAGRDAGGMMKNLQRSAQMQESFDRMLRRMERLRHMNTSSTEEMFDAMSAFMPPERQAEMRNMQSMMRMMSSMGKNMKPEDLFRMMGGAGTNQSGTA